MITRAPDRRAISTVASVDPSDTTWMLSRGTRAMMDRRLSSRTRASLCAGMSTATSRVVSGAGTDGARDSARPAGPASAVTAIIVPPFPVLANSVLANPLLANPLLANPLLANPLLADPLRRPASDSASRTRPTVPQSAKLAPSTKISSTHQGIMTPPPRY